MKTEDVVRDALQREAAKHLINPTLPSQTIRKARVSRVAMLAGVTVFATSVVFAGVGLVELGPDPGRSLDPGGEESATPREEQRESLDVPLLLVSQAGWKVIYVDQYGKEMGEMRFSNGDREVELSWRPRSTHEDYVEDRRRETEIDEEMDIAGRPAVLFQYEGTTDFTAMWIDGDYSLEFRGVFRDLDAFRDVAAALARVDEAAWLRAMPAWVVTPDERPATIDAMVADIPVHPKVDLEALKARRTIRDRYQLGAEVTSAVACAWIDQWAEAETAGDEAASREAVDAMRTSRGWAVLVEMKDNGGWSEVLWEYADAMTGDGTVTQGTTMEAAESYEQGLGCPGS